MKPSEKKCCFCGSTKNLESHHIIFKEYASNYEPDINHTSNLIWMCPHCHHKFHILVGIMLSFLTNQDCGY